MIVTLNGSLLEAGRLSRRISTVTTEQALQAVDYEMQQHDHVEMRASIDITTYTEHYVLIL